MTDTVSPNGRSGAETSALADLISVFKHSGTVASLVTIPTIGLNAYITSQLQPLLDTAQVLALTAPLCLSATVIAFLAFGGWFKHRNGLDGLVPLAVAMVVPYAIAYGFGLVEMYTDVYAGQDLGWQAYHPFMIVMRIPISILAYYFTAYGFQHTITSVFFGCALAWFFRRQLARIERAAQ